MSTNCLYLKPAVRLEARYVDNVAGGKIPKKKKPAKKISEDNAVLDMISQLKEASKEALVNFLQFQST